MFGGAGVFGSFMQTATKIADYMHAEEMQNDQQEFNHGQGHITREFNSAQAAMQRDWQERMASTEYQRATTDLKAAGLNPMLALMKGGNHAGTGATASASAPSSGIATAATPSGFAAALAAGTQAELNSATAAKTEAEREKVIAEKAEIEARTKTYPVSIEKMQSEIKSIDENVNRIMAETNKVVQEERTSAAQQHLFMQQRENLREEVHKIRALVDQAKQSTYTSAAHEREIAQRIKQNLPEIERALKDLELKLQNLLLPGRGMTAAANDSFLGAWRAAIRALTGQKD